MQGFKQCSFVTMTKAFADNPFIMSYVTNFMNLLLTILFNPQLALLKFCRHVYSRIGYFPLYIKSPFTSIIKPAWVNISNPNNPFISSYGNSVKSSWIFSILKLSIITLSTFFIKACSFPPIPYEVITSSSPLTFIPIISTLSCEISVWDAPVSITMLLMHMFLPLYTIFNYVNSNPSLHSTFIICNSP